MLRFRPPKIAMRLEWFKERWQPITTVLSLAIGVVGLYVGLSPKAARPTFQVSSTRVRIVDLAATAPSQIQVSVAGRLMTDQNITAVIVYFWNGGNQPIRPSDVLEPLTIVVPADVDILEAKILKQTRPVVGLTVPTNTQSVSPHAIQLSFNIIEPQDGAAIQIIFSGSPRAQVTMAGSVIGARSISSLSSNWLFTESDITRAQFHPLLTVAVALLMMFSAGLVWFAIRTAQSQALGRIVAVLFLFLGILLIYSVYRARFDIPGDIVFLQ